MYLVLFICLFSTIANSQTLIDSLKNELKHTDNLEQKAKVLNDLSHILKKSDWKKSLAYASESYAISKNTNNKEQLAQALYQIGVVNYYNISKDSAFLYYQKSLKLAKENDFKKIMCDNYMELAQWYNYVPKDSIKTVETYLQVIDIGKIIAYNLITGRAYAKLASFYTKKKNVEKATAYMDKSVPYFNAANDTDLAAYYYCELGNKIWTYNMKVGLDFYLKGFEIAPQDPHVMTGIGKAYLDIGKPAKAIDYLKKAIKRIDTSVSSNRYGKASTLLAEAHLALKNYDEANAISEANIDFLTPLSEATKRVLPRSYLIKGIINELEGNKEKALKNYTLALDKANDFGGSYEKALARFIIGNFYIKTDTEIARRYCELSLKTSKKYNYVKVQVSACDCLHKIYKQKNDFQAALKYFEQKEQIAESLLAQKALYSLDVYETLAAQEKEYTAQQTLKDKELKNQTRLNIVLSVALILGTLSIALLMFGIRRINKQKQEIYIKTQALETANERLNEKTQALETTNEKLQLSNQELERFAYIASHDLKTPLFNIIRYTGLLKHKFGNVDNQLVKDAFKFIDRGGKRMNNLIEDILEYSKLSDTKVLANNDNINLHYLASEIANGLFAKREKSVINVNLEAIPTIVWNNSKMFILLKNIIENGLKYNKSSIPTADIFSKKNNNGEHCIIIKDNGIGIEKEYYDKIFIMFNRLHNYGKFEGTGLGLSTCRKIVEEFGDKITLDSEVGVGTTFEINIPNSLIKKPPIKEGLKI